LNDDVDEVTGVIQTLLEVVTPEFSHIEEVVFEIKAAIDHQKLEEKGVKVFVGKTAMDKRPPGIEYLVFCAPIHDAIIF
jgi:hypothetical protein